MKSVQMDGAGRVVLPKELRERLRLEGGDHLSLMIKADAIELRPIKKRRQVKSVNGILVFSSGAPLEMRDFVSEEREARISELLQRNASEQ